MSKIPHNIEKRLDHKKSVRLSQDRNSGMTLYVCENGRQSTGTCLDEDTLFLIGDVINEYKKHNGSLEESGSNFISGDVIEYANDLYIVLENTGTSGKVCEYHDTSTIIEPFYWNYDGEKCKLIKRG